MVDVGGFAPASNYVVGGQLAFVIYRPQEPLKFALSQSIQNVHLESAFLGSCKQANWFDDT